MREKLARGDMSPREMREQYPMDKRPARIVGELQTARMLRAVASERQLQEVMVDFWFNHFNVFAGKGELRWYLTDYERDGDSPARARAVPRPAARDARGIPRCSSTSTTGSARGPDFVVRGGPNEGRLGRAQRELRARADGAAHARRRRRLHAARRHRGGARVHRLDDRPAAPGRALRLPVGHARLRRQGRPRAHDPAAAASATARHVLDMLARHPVDRPLHRRQAGPPVRGRRSAAGARRARGRRAIRSTGGDISRHAAGDLRLAGVRGPRRGRRQDQEALGVRGERGARASVRPPTPRGAFALARAAAEIGEGLYEAQPPTGYPDRAEAWVNPGHAAGADELRAGADRGPRARRARERGGARRRRRPRRPDAVLERLLAALIHGETGAGTRAVLVAQLGAPEITRLSRRRPRAGEHRRRQACCAGARLAGVPAAMRLTRRALLKSGACALAAAAAPPRFLIRAAGAAEAPGQGAGGDLPARRGGRAQHGAAARRPGLRARPRQHRARAARDGATPPPRCDLDGFFALHPALAPLMPAVGQPDPGDRARLRLARYHALALRRAGLHGERDARREEHARRLARPRRRRAAVRRRHAVPIGRARPRGCPAACVATRARSRCSSLDRFDVPRRAAGGGPTRASSRSTREGVRDLLHGTGRETFEAVKMLKSAGAARLTPANGADYPRGRFGEALRQIAQLVRADVGLRDRLRRRRRLGHPRGPGRRAGPAAPTACATSAPPWPPSPRTSATAWPTSSC